MPTKLGSASSSQDGTRVASGALLRAPTSLRCLRCQLIGRRSLLCSKVGLCKELPHSYWLGPMLLGAWLVTVVAFVLALR